MQILIFYPAFGSRTPPARESLYIVGDDGDLVEYLLDPHPPRDVERITESTEVQLSVTARSQWLLRRAHCDKERSILTPTIYPGN